MNHARTSSPGRPRTPRLAYAAVCVAAALASVAGTATATPREPAVPSAAGPAMHEIDARYRADRRACLDGRSGMDTGTCLREAGAARADAIRRRLDNRESPARLEAHALQRCTVHTDATDRAACQALVRGEGVESGSVEGGGVIREIVVRSVGSAASSADAQRAGPDRP